VKTAITGLRPVGASGQAVGTRACSTARARRTARPTGPSRR